MTSTNVCQCGSFVPQRVNFAPGREGDVGQHQRRHGDQWFDPTAYLVPALGTQGTAGRNTVRGPGTQRVNFSLSKRFPIDKARVEFRGEIFNLLNHNNFGKPDANISNRPSARSRRPTTDATCSSDCGSSGRRSKPMSTPNRRSRMH